MLDLFFSKYYQHFLKRKVTLESKYFEKILAKAMKEPYQGMLK
jgi:hypothetical protein